MKKILLVAVTAYGLLFFQGCANKVKVSCEKSCELLKDMDGKTSVSCKECTIEAEGKEDMKLFDFSLPSLPHLPNKD